VSKKIKNKKNKKLVNVTGFKTINLRRGLKREGEQLKTQQKKDHEEKKWWRGGCNVLGHE